MKASAAQSYPFDWDELLDYIEGRGVIPILGKELLTLSVDGREVSWESYLAARLAAALDLDARLLPVEPDLNAVALQFLRRGGALRKVYSKIKALVEERSLPIPEPLVKLAAITDFQLYVSTSFVPFLAEAIDRVRFQGEPRTKRLAYSLHAQIEDLPVEVRQLREPHVYFLLGLLSSSTDYAVTEEDTLEFLHALQSDRHRPKLLFDEFRSNHLLFLGCSFPDWLARFFVRTITNERLLLQRDTAQARVIADCCASGDPQLAVFLRQYQAEVFSIGSATEFVDELHRRWTERYPSARADKITPPPDPPDRKATESAAVFLSYTRKDHPAVLALKSALEEAGLGVWLDETKLEPGKSWDRQIRNNIRSCCLFLPLLSRHAQSRTEGYFRREWTWALDRAEGMDEEFPFIQPIVIDDLPAQSRGIPDGFWIPQCARFPGGRPSLEFVQGLCETVRARRLREAGRQ